MGDITHQSDIWRAILSRLMPGEPTSIDTIYDIVEKGIHLKPDDFLPSMVGSSDPVWRRNTRNVLQYRKQRKEIIWLGNGLYKIPQVDNFPPDSRLPQRRGQSEEEFNKYLDKCRKIGLDGELLVVKIERDSLIKKGKQELSEKVRRVSVEDIGRGYDVLSYEENGDEKYIEVKSTNGVQPYFEITKNELEVAKHFGKKYWLYHIKKLGSEPVIMKICDPLSEVGRGISLDPSAYTATISPSLIEKKW